jgi:hypothetical protein
VTSDASGEVQLCWTEPIAGGSEPSQGSEHRRYDARVSLRAPIAVPVEIRSPKRRLYRLAWAIGEDGIRLEQAAPLERGRPVEVRFALPDGEPLALRAEIGDDDDDPDHDERSRELTFIDAPEEARLAIHRYVAARLELPQ